MIHSDNINDKNCMIRILIISVILTILSFILVSGICELIAYCQTNPSGFSGDKFGRTPEEFFRMRIFINFCYAGIIIFPAYLISLPFLYLFVGPKVGKIAYLYAPINSALLSVLLYAGKIDELGNLIIRGNFLLAHFIIVISYFICSHMLMTLLLPSSNLRHWGTTSSEQQK